MNPSVLPRAMFPRVALAALAAACAGAPEKQVDEKVFFPEPPDPPRLQFLRSVSKAADVEPGRSGLDRILFGDPEDSERPILRPFGCAVRDGIVYVTDTRLGAIMRLDFRRRKLDLVMLKGRAKVKKPMNLCFAADGTCYVADAGRRQVVVMDPSFRYVAEFGPFDEKSRPVDVEVHGERLYVVDSGAMCLRVLDRETGDQLLELGNDPDPDRFMRGPTSVAVDRNGYAYVSDTIIGKVFVWSPQGEFVRHIGEPGDVVGQFARPKGIAVWGRTLWVLDAAFENCQIFAFDGEPLMFFGGAGGNPGNLYMPATIWIGKEGLEVFEDLVDPDFEAEALVAITSQFGPRKVSFFAFGRSRKFQYPDVELPAVPPPQKKSEQNEDEKSRDRK